MKKKRLTKGRGNFCNNSPKDSPIKNGPPGKTTFMSGNPRNAILSNQNLTKKENHFADTSDGKFSEKSGIDN